MFSDSDSGNCYRHQVQEKPPTIVVSSPKAETNGNSIIARSTSAAAVQTTSLSASNNNIPQKALPHSIQLIEIPWSRNSRNTIRLSIDDTATTASVATPDNNCPIIRISE